MLSSILRMCTKYQIPRVCKEILQRIQTEWPHTLAEHDARMHTLRVQHTRTAEFIVQNGANVPNPDYDADAANREDLIIHPGSVIALLRDCDAATAQVLTPLFYALSRGTWQFGGAAVGHHIAPLAYADIERLIIGIERLRTHYADSVTRVPTIVGIPPQHKGRCDVGAQKYWASLGPALLKATEGIRQPIEDWASIVQQARTSPHVVGQYGVCPECGKLVVAEMEKRREALWKAMPAYFELEGAA